MAWVPWAITGVLFAPMLVAEDSVVGTVLNPLTCALVGMGCKSDNNNGGGGGGIPWMIVVPIALCCMSLPLLILLLVIK